MSYIPFQIINIENQKKGQQPKQDSDLGDPLVTSFLQNMFLSDLFFLAWLLPTYSTTRINKTMIQISIYDNQVVSFLSDYQDLKSQPTKVSRRVLLRTVGTSPRNFVRNCKTWLVSS